MAVTSMPYATLLADLGAARHDFIADTDKVALLTNAYTPDLSAHVTFADVNGSEVSGSGYTAGGIALPSKTWSYNGTTGYQILGAGPISWTDLAVTTRYAVVYKDTGSAGTSRLIGLFDFGEDRVYAVEPFQMSFPSGVVALTAITG